VILHLFKRTVKEHFGFHLLIPVVLMILVAAWTDPTLRSFRPAPWIAFLWHLPSEKLAELIVVYLSFFMVVAWSVRRAGAVQSTRVETLRDILPDAKRYFAIGVIPLWEWFDPSSVVYLCTIIQHQMASPNFQHERVLLFRHRKDLDALSVSYLDEPYAKAFVSIHARFNIPLGYLEPTDVVRLLTSLTDAEKDALRCRRRWVSWLRSRWPKIPATWTVSSPPPFALVEKIDGTYVVFRFEKRGKTLVVSLEEEASVTAAVRAVVETVTRTVYQPGTRTLKEQFRFGNYLCP
jgi:hypothetical protein